MSAKRALRQSHGPVLGAPTGSTTTRWDGLVPAQHTPTERGHIFWDLKHGTRTVVHPNVPVLDGVAEFRDPIGRAGGRPGMLFRSAKLCNATATDRLTLRALMSSGDIIDLRTGGRAAKEPDPLLPGVTYRRISLPPTAYVPYEDLVTIHRVQLRDVLTALASWATPSLVHCTEGKDRTGIVVAFVMMLVGFTEAQARNEFLTTAGAERRHWDRMVQKMHWEIGRPSTLEWLTSKPNRWNVGLGLDPDVRAALIQKFRGKETP